MIKGPEDEKDMWEGENLQKFGEIAEKYFLPVLVVLGLVVGGIAAGTYNDGASVFLQGATGPDADAVLIPADAISKATAGQ